MALKRRGLLVCGRCHATARIEVRPDACFACGERAQLYVVWAELGAGRLSLRLERPGQGGDDGGQGNPPDST